MDNQERHDLKQNELAEALGNFGEFWKKYGNAVMIFITLVVVAIAGYRLYSSHQRAQFESSWADLAEAPSPFAKADVGATAAFASTRAMGHLNAADLYLKESLTPPSGDGLATTPAESLDLAAEHYALVLEEDVHEAFALNAKLGLAVVAEGKGELDKAAAGFEEVIQLAGDVYPAHAAAARAHLALRERLENPIPLAADPPPASLLPPPPTTVPDATDDAAGDAADDAAQPQPQDPADAEPAPDTAAPTQPEAADADAATP